MTIANQSALIGVSNDSASTSALFPLGTVVVMGDNSYTYAKAASTQAAAATFALDGSFGTTTGTTFTHDVGGSGVASGQYFFAKKVASPFA